MISKKTILTGNNSISLDSDLGKHLYKVYTSYSPVLQRYEYIVKNIMKVRFTLDKESDIILYIIQESEGVYSFMRGNLIEEKMDKLPTHGRFVFFKSLTVSGSFYENNFTDVTFLGKDMEEGEEH
jgi:hypothetical protein